MQTRRGFIQRMFMALGAVAISGSTLFLTACGNVANDLVTAFNSILNILSAAGLVPGGALVVTALEAVLSEVTAYINAPAADKTSIGQDLSLAIQLAQARLQTWFTGLGLTGTLAVVIESLVSVLLSTLAGFLPPLPVPVTLSKEIKESRDTIVYRPVAVIHCTKSGLRAASKQFQSSFNSVLTAKGYQKVF
jgi:hypothetical protein